MGKKRVTYGINDEDKPPNHNLPVHQQQHRHRNHEKTKKIKPEAKLLRTLNSQLKKLAKFRSKKLISLSSPPSLHPTDILHKNNKNNRAHLSSWLKHDHTNKDDRDEWFMDFDIDIDRDDMYHDYGGDMKSFDFGQELFLKTTSSFLRCENNEDLFGGDIVFAPDLSASHNIVVVFGEHGLGYGSYIPDPIMNLDNGNEGRHIYDILKLSSQEEMINEFLKVKLFVS